MAVGLQSEQPLFQNVNSLGTEAWRVFRSRIVAVKKSMYFSVTSGPAAAISSGIQALEEERVTIELRLGNQFNMGPCYTSKQSVTHSERI
jgi:hypothetical protein